MGGSSTGFVWICAGTPRIRTLPLPPALLLRQSRGAHPSPQPISPIPSTSPRVMCQQGCPQPGGRCHRIESTVQAIAFGVENGCTRRTCRTQIRMGEGRFCLQGMWSLAICTSRHAALAPLAAPPPLAATRLPRLATLRVWRSSGNASTRPGAAPGASRLDYRGCGPGVAVRGNGRVPQRREKTRSSKIEVKKSLAWIKASRVVCPFGVKPPRGVISACCVNSLVASITLATALHRISS